MKCQLVSAASSGKGVSQQQQANRVSQRQVCVNLDRRQMGNFLVGTSLLMVAGGAQARDLEAARKADQELSLLETESTQLKLGSSTGSNVLAERESSTQQEDSNYEKSVQSQTQENFVNEIQEVPVSDESVIEVKKSDLIEMPEEYNTQQMEQSDEIEAQEVSGAIQQESLQTQTETIGDIEMKQEQNANQQEYLKNENEKVVLDDDDSDDSDDDENNEGKFDNNNSECEVGRCKVVFDDFDNENSENSSELANDGTTSSE